MATINQLYSILNTVASESLGDSATTVIDTSSMVSLGDDVLSSDESVDSFLSSLLDRVGRTVVSIRGWNDPQKDPLVKKPFDYGTTLQKIYVDIEDASINNAWNIGNDDYTPTFAPVNKPDARQKLFNKISTWEYDYTIPDHLLKTAFTNENAMMAFINAIFISMENSMNLALRNANNLTRATACAYTIHNGGNNAINLLSEYNTLFSSATLTQAECLYSPEFLQYATKRILDVNRYIKDMSRVWNNENFARHTPDDDKILTMLQTFDSAGDVYLKSSTFHDKLLDLGTNYNTVSFWQGAGETYSLSDISSIKITIKDSESDTGYTDVSQSGVLACLHDVESLGTTINNRRTTTERNNKDEYTDYFSKANIGYYYDGSENFVVFYAG